MIVMTNPVIGFLFSCSSFKLNKEGLYKKVYTNNKTTPKRKYDLFLTNDVRKVCEIIGIDFDVFDACTDLEESYKLICTSEYTKIQNILDKKFYECKSMHAFREWLIDNPEYVIPGVLRTERVSTILGIDIEERMESVRYDAIHFIEEKRKKIAGPKFFDALPGYDKHNFGLDLSNFITSFDELDYMHMVVNNSFEEILEKFKQSINY